MVGGKAEGELPGRRVLIHLLAELDHYFFELSEGRERVYDMLELPEEEPAAEHRLRHDLLLALYEELKPAFDVSLSWPPNGYEVGERGEIIDLKDPGRTSGSAGVGYDHVYDLEVFYEGNAGEEGYGEGSWRGAWSASPTTSRGKRSS
jgi:hypothetical protein